MKSAKDGLWTEQRMWLRSLLEVHLFHDPYLFQTLHLIRTLTLSRWAASTTLIRASFKPSSSIPYPNQAGYLHYSNPYLFDAEGEALVKISICKVDFNLQAIT